MSPRLAATAVDLRNVPTLPSVRVCRFFERRLRHGKGQFAGLPFKLEPWQIDDLVVPIYDDVVVEGQDLIRQIHEALAGVAKKNGKTHIAAGLGAYSLAADGYWHRDPNGWIWVPEYGAEVYNIAGSRDQAKVLFQIGSGFVLRDPQLRSMCKVYRDAIEIPETESVWRVLAADARLAHGPNPSVTIIDEIWTHKSPELYEAFASAGAARRQPLVIIITTAGWDQNTIAYKLYQRAQRWEAARTRAAKPRPRSRSTSTVRPHQPRRPDPHFYAKWHQGPEGCAIDDAKARRAANPSKWVTKAYLDGELKRARELGLESQHRRWHLNQWTSSRELAIPLELWKNGDGKAQIPKRAEVVIGVDSAPKRDSTGIVVAYKDAGGVHHWAHTKMVPDPDTGYLDFGRLEETLRQLCRSFDVQRILCDPYSLIPTMVKLGLGEGLPIEDFPQEDRRMVPASMNVYELLMQGRLRHGGDPELRRQIGAAAKQVTERGWRFKKRTSSGSIDGIIAGAMASYILELPGEPEELPPQPSLFVYKPTPA